MQAKVKDRFYSEVSCFRFPEIVIDCMSSTTFTPIRLVCHLQRLQES
jgi:hypothetical protein